MNAAGNSRVALVTGAGRGIGRAIALRLSGAGYRAALCARSEEQLHAVGQQIGEAARVYPCDLADADQLERLIELATSEQGEIDILVNNAGTTSRSKFIEADAHAWKRVMEVNFHAPLRLTQALLPGMLARGWGRIINIASTAGLRGIMYGAPYAASKHALMGLTRSLALELAGTGVTVNAICPGWVETDMMDASLAEIMRKTGRTHEQALEAVLKGSGQRRVVTPEEVAEQVEALVEDEANGEEVLMLGN